MNILRFIDLIDFITCCIYSYFKNASYSIFRFIAGGAGGTRITTATADVRLRGLIIINRRINHLF